MPRTQSVEGYYSTTLLQIFHVVYFQLDFILHAHVRLYFSYLALFTNRISSFPF